MDLQTVLIFASSAVYPFTDWAQLRNRLQLVKTPVILASVSYSLLSAEQRSDGPSSRSALVVLRERSECGGRMRGGRGCALAEHWINACYWSSSSAKTHPRDEEIGGLRHDLFGWYRGLSDGATYVCPPEFWPCDDWEAEQNDTRQARSYKDVLALALPEYLYLRVTQSCVCQLATLKTVSLIGTLSVKPTPSNLWRALWRMRWYTESKNIRDHSPKPLLCWCDNMGRLVFSTKCLELIRPIPSCAKQSQ